MDTKKTIMIQENLKILLVEDNLEDAQLIEYHIKKIIKQPELIHVDTFEGFKNTLNCYNPDVIISDYKMNGFNGMEVLLYTKKNSLIHNFIFITGTVDDEELAAETILNGATGYILKKNLKSLHLKLLPYFQKIVESKKMVKLPIGHKEMFESMRAYIESAKRDNQAHWESFEEIKKTLNKYKAFKKNA